jgi:hypothetical protein
MRFLGKLLLVALGVIFSAPLIFAANVHAEEYYTKVNIWYEEPAKILSTNYHRGAIIPFGTKVNILSSSGEKIKFTTQEEQGVTFVITNVRKYSLMDTAELLSQYFTKEDPKSRNSEYAKFSAKEKENIESGSIEEGMSKEAVIASYGYPPKHRTPALTSNVWTYWDARSTRRQVTFKNNRLAKIEFINEYDEGRPHWYHYVP